MRFANVMQIKRDTTGIRPQLTHYTNTPASHELYEYAQKPPLAQELVLTTDDHDIPDKIYQDVYYSKEADAPDHAKEYAGILFRIPGGTGLSTLEEWDGEGQTPVPGLLKRKPGPLLLPTVVGMEGWEYSQCPPSRREVRSWLVANPAPTEAGGRKATWASQVNH